MSPPPLPRWGIGTKRVPGIVTNQARPRLGSYHAGQLSRRARSRSHPLLGTGLTLAIPFGPARFQYDCPSFRVVVWSWPGQSRRNPAVWSLPHCCQLPARAPNRMKLLPWLIGDPQTCVLTAPAAADLTPLPYVGPLLWHPAGCMPVCACVHVCECMHAFVSPGFAQNAMLLLHLANRSFCRLRWVTHSQAFLVRAHGIYEEVICLQEMHILNSSITNALLVFWQVFPALAQT